jgi:Flp pilus assembly pilin Flp
MRPFKLFRDERGAAAVEYALVLPVFITLIIGALCLGSVAFAANGLHYAVQDAARCAAVKTTVCSNSSTTIAYAQSRYSGPKIAPVFTFSTAGCGHTVTGAGSYPLILAVATIHVPLSASACYP